MCSLHAQTCVLCVFVQVCRKLDRVTVACALVCYHGDWTWPFKGCPSRWWDQITSMEGKESKKNKSGVRGKEDRKEILEGGEMDPEDLLMECTKGIIKHTCIHSCESETTTRYTRACTRRQTTKLGNPRGTCPSKTNLLNLTDISTHILSLCHTHGFIHTQPHDTTCMLALSSSGSQRVKKDEQIRV